VLELRARLEVVVVAGAGQRVEVEDRHRAAPKATEFNASSCRKHARAQDIVT
jgi:hypothetical protein